MRPEALSAVVVVLLLVAGSVALVRTQGHQARAGDAAKVAVTPLPTSAPQLPSPNVSVPPTPRLVPTPPPTAAGAVPLVGGGSVRRPVSATAKPSVTECVGPLPPGHRAEAKCDVGKHTGLPTGCRWDGFCAWWDSWGAVLAGPGDVPITVTPAGDLDISWDIDPAQLQGNEYSGPLKEFVLRVFEDGSYTRLRQYELGVDVRSMTVSGLGPGRYDVCVMELNDSGLGGLCPGTVTIPPPSESPSPTPTPTPSASATPSPSATSTA